MKDAPTMKFCQFVTRAMQAGSITIACISALPTARPCDMIAATTILETHAGY